MARLLHLNCSPRATNSQSLAVANAFRSTFADEHPDWSVDEWDLFDGSLPEFSTHAAEAKIATFFGREHTPEQAAAWAAARSAFARFAAADTYLFNIPMWNHGTPYELKKLIDVITQPGWAFGFDPASGYSGLLNDKRAVVIYTSGVYADNRPPAFGTDFLTPYMNDWLAFVGIDDVTEIKLFGQVINFDAEAAAEAAMEKAREAATAAGVLRA